MRDQRQNSIIYKTTVKLRLLVLAISLFCVQSKPANGQTRFHYLTENEGIVGSTIRNCFADSRGFSWITTETELIRFDGFNLRKYKGQRKPERGFFKGTAVLSGLVEDPDGNLLFLTESGLNSYRRKADHFLSFPIENASILKVYPTEIHGDSIVVFLDTVLYKAALGDINEETISQSKGLKWRKRKIPHWMIQSNPNSIGFRWNSSDGRSYRDFLTGEFPVGQSALIFNTYHINDTTLLALTEKGIYVFFQHANTYLHESTFDGKSLGANSGIAHDIAKKRYWLGGFNQRFFEFDYTLKKLRKSYPLHHPNGTELSGRIDPLWVDGYDNLYLKMFDAGLATTNLRKIKFDHFFTTEDAKIKSTSSFIRCIVQDHDGNVWCGTHGKGVLVFSPDKKLRHTFRVDPSNEAYNNEVQQILVDKVGQVWVATWHGLFVYQAESKSFKQINTGGRNQCNCLLQLNDGRIITYLNHSGLFEIRKEGKDFLVLPFYLEDSRLDEYESHLFQAKDGRLFVSNFSRTDVYKPTANGGFTFEKQLSFSANTRHFWEDETRHCTWVATSVGLMKLDSKTLTYKHIVNLNPNADNYMYSALPDQKGRLWISTNRGLCRYEPESGKFRNYTMADGLQGWEFNSFAFHRFADGQMWFGGIKGLNAFHPDSVRDFPHLPGIQITAMQVNDKPFYTPNYIGETDSLHFDFEHNTLAFNFVAIELADGKNCPVQYRLVGKDVGWVPVSNPGIARYATLAAGEYWLEIKAANSDGIWNPKVKRLYIKIDPPWWQTFWFYGICVLSLVGLVYLLYRYQLRQALTRERIKIETEARERSRISRDLHDRIGSNLGSISFYSEMAQKLQESGPEQMAEILKRIEVSSRESVENMADIVWALKLENESFQKIMIRLQNFAAEVLGSKSIDVQFELDPLLESVKMSLENRTNLYLIAKEGVYNAAKYSLASRVEISLKKKENGFLFTLTDNGIGFEKKEVEAARNGNGLVNMEQRAKEMKARFSITSGYGSGTCIEVEGVIG